MPMLKNFRLLISSSSKNLNYGNLIYALIFLKGIIVIIIFLYVLDQFQRKISSTCLNLSNAVASSSSNHEVYNKTNAPIFGSKGTGGRSSNSGNVVTVFGASGNVGRILINRLGKEGSQIVIPYRGDVSDLRPLKLCADLGNIYFQVEHIFF
jgi:uncharacterized protein (UPF0333 family)